MTPGEYAPEGVLPKTGFFTAAALESPARYSLKLGIGNAPVLDVAQGLFEYLQAVRCLRPGEDQGRRQLDDLAEDAHIVDKQPELLATDDELRALFGRRLLRALVGDQLNADDQPGSAHLADQRMASGHLPDAVHDQLALSGGVVGQPLVPDDVEGGDGCSARGRRARGGEGVSRDRDIENLGRRNGATH